MHMHKEQRAAALHDALEDEGKIGELTRKFAKELAELMLKRRQSLNTVAMCHAGGDAFKAACLDDITPITMQVGLITTQVIRETIERDWDGYYDPSFH